MSLGADGGALVAVMCSLKIYTQPPFANQSWLFVCHSQARRHGGVSVVYYTTVTEYHGAAKRLYLIEPKMWPLLCMAAGPSMDGLDPPLAPNSPPGATVPPPGRLRAPTEDAQKGPQVNSTAILSAVVRVRRDWVLPARPDDRPPATGDGRVLVVQLRKEPVALPPVYGVPGAVAADPRLVREDRKGVPLGAPEGTGVAKVVEGGNNIVP